jgi:hypothetical protein
VKFLDRYQVPKLNNDQINDLNSPISHKEIEVVINICPTKNQPNKQTKKPKKQKTKPFQIVDKLEEKSCLTSAVCFEEAKGGNSR